MSCPEIGLHKCVNLFQDKTKTYFEKKRTEQNQYWLLETINGSLQQHFYTNPKIMELLEKNKKAVQDNKKSPFEVANQLLKTYFDNN